MTIAAGQEILAEHIHSEGTSDPASPVNGQTWYRTDTGKLYRYLNGATKQLYPPEIIPDKLNLAIALGATPAAQIDINADCIILYNATNNAGKAYHDIDITIDITASGANGLDTGAEANSTWYYIWVIGKDDGTVAGLFSTSSTAPTLPSGYIYKRLIGAVRNDSSGNFVAGQWNNGWFYYNVIQTIYSGNGTTSWTDADCSAYIPENITRVALFKGMTGQTSPVALRLKTDTTSYDAGSNGSGLEPQQMLITTAGVISWRTTSSDRAMSWGMLGYKNVI